MTQTYGIYWDGSGPALQEDNGSLEELEDLGKQWKIRDGKHRGIVAEVLAAHADELIPDEERIHAVELEASKAEDPSGIAERLEANGRETLYVDPSSKYVRKFLDDVEIQELEKTQEQKREEELAPDNWRDEAIH